MPLIDYQFNGQYFLPVHLIIGYVCFSGSKEAGASKYFVPLVFGGAAVGTAAGLAYLNKESLKQLISFKVSAAEQQRFQNSVSN